LRDIILGKIYRQKEVRRWRFLKPLLKKPGRKRGDSVNAAGVPTGIFILHAAGCSIGPSGAKQPKVVGKPVKLIVSMVIKLPTA
jgi:hypothetical protein